MFPCSCERISSEGKFLTPPSCIATCIKRHRDEFVAPGAPQLRVNPTVTSNRMTKCHNMPENRDQRIGLNGSVKQIIVAVLIVTGFERYRDQFVAPRVNLDIFKGAPLRLRNPRSDQFPVRVCSRPLCIRTVCESQLRNPPPPVLRQVSNAIETNSWHQTHLSSIWNNVNELEAEMLLYKVRCTHTHTHTHTRIYIYIHTHTHIYIYIYICNAPQLHLEQRDQYGSRNAAL